MEDVCISADHQGQQFGTKLIKALDHIASERGCYKVSRLCSIFSFGIRQ